MVVELDFRKPHAARAGNEEAFKKVVKGAFAHRRKTLINSLRGTFPTWDQEGMLSAIKKGGIDPGKRAERMGVDDFIRLSEILESFFDKAPTSC
jgi:16S rRNA (adenine1518-N6/adenine1519-N6)-dimethyltransferase